MDGIIRQLKTNLLNLTRNQIYLEELNLRRRMNIINQQEYNQRSQNILRENITYKNVIAIIAVRFYVTKKNFDDIVTKIQNEPEYLDIVEGKPDEYYEKPNTTKNKMERSTKYY